MYKKPAQFHWFLLSPSFTCRKLIFIHSNLHVLFPSLTPNYTDTYPSIPRLYNNTHLLSNLSLRNALLICNNRSDNTLTSCWTPLSFFLSPTYTHTQLFSRSSNQWQTHHDSSWFSVTSASQTFIPAVTSCLTAALNINTLLQSFPGSTCIKIQITKRKKANKWLICASKSGGDKALTSENMSEGLWVTSLCFGS